MQIQNSQEFIDAINHLDNPVGRGVVLELKANTEFKLDQSLVIRKRIILRGNGSMLKFKQDVDGIQITTDPAVHPIHTAHGSVLQDLTINAPYPPTANQNHGIRCRVNGLRMYNVSVGWFGVGLSFDSRPPEAAPEIFNCNSCVVRDCRIDGRKEWTTGVYLHGKDSNAITFDHMTISGAKIGVLSRNLLANSYYDVYVEDYAESFRIEGGADYSSFFGCIPDGGTGHVHSDSGNILSVGGTLPSHNFPGDRIGRGQSRLIFSDYMQDGRAIRVNIPAAHRFRSPMFWQIKDYTGDEGDPYGFNIHFDKDRKEWSMRSERGTATITWAGEGHPTASPGELIGQ